MALTPEEIKKVKVLAEIIRARLLHISEKDKILEDIAGLKLETVEELGVLYPLLLVYLALAKKEQTRFDPLVLYEAGKNARLAGKEQKSALYEFYMQEASSADTDKLYRDMQHYHDLICRALGDKKGLLHELLEEYRLVYGGLNRSADFFFNMGYDSIKE